MLDSNVLIDVARDMDGSVSKVFEGKKRGELSISVIVSGALRYGMRKNPIARNNARMAYLLNGLRTDPLEIEVDELYGTVRRTVENSGKSLPPNDYWIVAHALSREAVLVTGDQAIHDAGISMLKVENWRTGFVV
jgi:tRNA(fMet)-specific endonuclease VapC